MRKLVVEKRDFGGNWEKSAWGGFVEDVADGRRAWATMIGHAELGMSDGIGCDQNLNR